MKRRMICSKSQECGGPKHCTHIKEHFEVPFCKFSCHCTHANGNVTCVEITRGR